MGAALTNRRVFEPVEDRILLATSALLIGLAVLFFKFPAVLHYPVIVLLLWFGVAILIKACKLFWERRRRRMTGQESEESGSPDERRI